MNGEATEHNEGIPNQPTGDTDLGPLVVGKTIEIAPAQVLDIGHYERLLEDVPDRYSSTLTPEQRAAYEAASIERWDSLTKQLASVLEIEAEELDKARISGFLVESAQFQPSRTQSRLPNGYRAMYTVMLWKYLQGAPREEVQRAACSVDKEFIAKVSAIRTTFINFIGSRVSKGDDKGGKVPPKVKGKDELPAAKPRNALMDRTAEGNRLFEQESRNAYQRTRRTETRDSGAEKMRLAADLAAAFGGNTGAYGKVFNVVAELVVEEEDIPDVRNRLWGAVISNIKRWSLDSANRLNNEEVKWLAPLCGKKLVANKETKRLEPVDAEPLSLDEMKVLASTLYKKGAYGDQPPRTADDVEYIIMSACRKLAGHSA